MQKYYNRESTSVICGVSQDIWNCWKIQEAWSSKVHLALGVELKKQWCDEGCRWGGGISLKYKFTSGSWNRPELRDRGLYMGGWVPSHTVTGVTGSFVLKEVTCEQGQQMQQWPWPGGRPGHCGAMLCLCLARIKMVIHPQCRKPWGGGSKIMGSAKKSLSWCLYVNETTFYRFPLALSHSWFVMPDSHRVIAQNQE